MTYGGAPELLQAKVREEMGLGRTAPPILETVNPNAPEVVLEDEYYVSVDGKPVLMLTTEDQELIITTGDVLVVKKGGTQWVKASEAGFFVPNVTKAEEVDAHAISEDPKIAALEIYPNARLQELAISNGVAVMPFDRDAVIKALADKGVTG